MALVRVVTALFFLVSLAVLEICRKAPAGTRDI